MDRKHEEILEALNDDEYRKEYTEKYSDYKVGIIPRLLGNLLVFSGDLVYGKKPSYGKFRAVEVIARIPYQSWELVSYMFLTALYGNEQRAINLTYTSRFGRVAQDNETMHVVVMSQLARQEKQVGFIRHYLIPVTFSFFYFLVSMVLYAVHKKSALELNYMFECHAFEQYSEFVEEHAEELKKKVVDSKFLMFYGRNHLNEYDLLSSIRDDELIHRNRSLERMSSPRV